MGTRRSNSKEIKQEIQAHILECIELEEEYETVSEELEQVIGGFQRWWSDHEQIRNHQEAFTSYLMCLPSEFTVEFQTYSMEQRLEGWLGKGSREYTTDEISTRYYWLIYREFHTLCRKHKVTFY